MGRYKKTILLSSLIVVTVLMLVYRHHVLQNQSHAKNVKYLSAMFGSPLPASFKILKEDVIVPSFLPCPDSDGGADYTIQCDRKEFLLLLSHKPDSREYLYDYGEIPMDNFDYQLALRSKGYQKEYLNNHGNIITDKFNPQKVPQKVIIAVFPKEENSMRANFEISNPKEEKIVAKVELNYHPRHWLYPDLMRKAKQAKTAPKAVQGQNTLQQLQIIR